MVGNPHWGVLICSGLAGLLSNCMGPICCMSICTIQSLSSGVHHYITDTPIDLCILIDIAGMTLYTQTCHDGLDETLNQQEEEK